MFCSVFVLGKVKLSKKCPGFSSKMLVCEQKKAWVAFGQVFVRLGISLRLTTF